LRLPARGSLLEAALTSLVLTAAGICWINELLDDGVVGGVGIAAVIALVGWVWTRRDRIPEKPDRPLLIGGTVALLLGVVFQVLSA
jgi:hypothetical protein